MSGRARVLPWVVAVMLSCGLSTSATARPLIPRANGASFSTTIGPYAYDADGNIETIGGATPMAFTYDGLGRLHTASVAVPGRTAITQTYEYDQFGNRKSATGAGSVCVRQLNCDQPPGAFGIDATTNRLTAGSGGDVEYNGRGGVTKFGTTSFTYAPDDAVATEERPTETRYYLYTASGERVAVYTVPKDARPKRWEWSLRDESGKVLSRYTSSDDPQASIPGTANLTLTEDLFYRDGLMFASKSGTAVNYFHLDHLGTPRLITSAAGGKVGEHAYLPFGPELEWPGRISESPEEAAKFTGHERDSRADAGMLDYMHARYYGGVVGRFLSVDQGRPDLKKPQSWNRYSYTMNNPINNTDPDGRETNPVTGESYILDSQILVSKNNSRKGFFGMVRRNADGSPKKHGGNDIKAPRGTPVFAPVTGIVVQSGWAGGDGGFVLRIRRADDENGRPVYVHISHLNSAPSVQVGDKVVEGQPNVAEVGNTGNAKNEDPHAHTAVMVGGQSKDDQVDPQQWFRDHPSNAPPQPEKKKDPCEPNKQC